MLLSRNSDRLFSNLPFKPLNRFLSLYMSGRGASNPERDFQKKVTVLREKRDKPAGIQGAGGAKVTVQGTSTAGVRAVESTTMLSPTPKAATGIRNSAPSSVDKGAYFPPFTIT